MEPVFRSVLDGLFDRVRDTIERGINEARNAGIELEIEAGEEISRAVSQIKNVYEKELDKSIEAIDREAKQAFDTLNSLVQNFEKRVSEETAELMVQAQKLFNTLPFAKWQPQLTAVKPRHLVIGDLAHSSFVVFNGNFPYSAKPGYEPSLTFGNSCFLADTSTQSFTFKVPHSAFEGAENDKYSYRTGLLTVPYDDGIIFSHKVEYKYKVGLGALPRIAGSGTVEYVADEKEHHAKHIKRSFSYDGSNWYPQNPHTLYEKIHPDLGWTIDTSKKPNMTVHHVSGTHSQGIESAAPDQIVLKVELNCKHSHNMAKVNIDVEFEQYQDVPIQKIRQENFEMNWKDSMLLKPQGHEIISNVTFDDYKGTHQEYGGPSLNGVLKVAAEGKNWKIWAEPPKGLSLSAGDLTLKLKEDLIHAQRLQYLLDIANIK